MIIIKGIISHSCIPFFLYIALMFNKNSIIYESNS